MTFTSKKEKKAFIDNIQKKIDALPKTGDPNVEKQRQSYLSQIKEAQSAKISVLSEDKMNKAANEYEAEKANEMAADEAGKNFGQSVKNGLEKNAKSRENVDKYHKGEKSLEEFVETDKELNPENYIDTTPYKNKQKANTKGIDMAETNISNLERKDSDVKSNDVINESKEKEYNNISEAQSKAVESLDKNATQDRVKNANEKVAEQTKEAEAFKKFPKSVWQAWKNGEFNTDMDPDGKKTRNYLMLNSALNAVSNGLKGFRNGAYGESNEMTKSLWNQKRNADFQNSIDRENKILNTGAETQAKNISDAAGFDIAENANINNKTTDSTFNVADNTNALINDKLVSSGMDVELGDIYNKMSPAQRQNLLDAKNMFENGKLADAEVLIRNSIGDAEYAKWIKQLEDIKTRLSINADARAQEQLEYMESMGAAGLLMQAAGLLL